MFYLQLKYYIVMIIVLLIYHPFVVSFLGQNWTSSCPQSTGIEMHSNVLSHFFSGLKISNWWRFNFFSKLWSGQLGSFAFVFFFLLTTLFLHLQMFSGTKVAFMEIWCTCQCHICNQILTHKNYFFEWVYHWRHMK